MPLFAIVVGLGIFGAMVYLVLSKKTDRRIRVVALVALGVMILAVIVCAALIFWGSPGAADEGLYLLDETAAASETAGNSFVIIAFILFLIALFVIVLIFLMRNLRAEKAGK